MKFTLNGREYEDYQLSNEQIVELIEGDNEVTDMGHEFLMKKVYERFKNTLCPKSGEDKNDVFAHFFSEYVNHCPNDFKRAAKAMAREHRYLQNEMFKVCIEYVRILAQNYANGCYDGRNAWACDSSKKILDYFNEIGHPY